MKEFYIIRHGETDFNLQGVVQGRGVNSELNEKGHSQAKSFYKAYNHVSFDKIYTSTLKRTHQTVAPFIKNGHTHKWEQHEGLDELDWGIYEGMQTSPELKSAFYDVLNKWAKGELHQKMKDGESPLEVSERQDKVLKHILSRTDEQKILICMHGRAMRLLLCRLLGKELSEMDTFPHTNLSLYRLKYDDKGFHLLDFNNTAHLNG